MSVRGSKSWTAEQALRRWGSYPLHFLAPSQTARTRQPSSSESPCICLVAGCDVSRMTGAADELACCKRAGERTRRTSANRSACFVRVHTRGYPDVRPPSSYCWRDEQQPLSTVARRPCKVRLVVPGLRLSLPASGTYRWARAARTRTRVLQKSSHTAIGQPRVRAPCVPPAALHARRVGAGISGAGLASRSASAAHSEPVRMSRRL